MSSDVLLVFDDIVHGTSDVYSSSFAELSLGESEAYAMQCVVEGITAVESVTVQLETSGDGRNWRSKNPTAEINASSTPAGAVTAVYGCDVGNFPALALVRARIRLGIDASSTARVRLWVRQRPAGYVTPGKVPGCKLWLRADQGITFGAGSAVSSWTDLSGNGNHATQSTAGRRPTWTQSLTAFNGNPAVSFDGSDDVLGTAAFALGTYAILMVTTGQDGTNGWFWTRTTSSAVVDTLLGTNSSTLYSSRGGTTSGWSNTAGWGQWGSTTARVLLVTMDGTHAGHTLRMNGSTLSLTNDGGSNPGTSTTSDQFTIGARDDAVLPSNIDVAEVAVFNSALTTPQLTALEEYARRRYKLY